MVSQKPVGDKGMLMWLLWSNWLVSDTSLFAWEHCNMYQDALIMQVTRCCLQGTGNGPLSFLRHSLDQAY